MTKKLIPHVAHFLTFLLRRAIKDEKKRAEVIEQAKQIIAEVSEVLYEVQPLR